MRSPRRMLAALVLFLAVAAGIYLVVRMSERSTATNSAPTESELLHLQIYPEGSQATGDLANALAQAARENKRVLIDFGGNWCGDCRVLDFYLHEPQNLALLQANYVLVHVNIGNYDQNLDLAAKYGIPLQKGVPALAVLSPGGQLLYSQRHGEFESMGQMDVSSVTTFLTEWKGATRG